MEKYIIAGKKTAYYVRGKLLKQRSKDYKADFSDDEIQIKLRIKKAFIDAKKEEMPNLSWEEHEYMWTCQAFYSELLRWNGIMLHASCVEKDGFAYLFSAPSGTGKSTHTHLWLENLKNTRIIVWFEIKPLGSASCESPAVADNPVKNAAANITVFFMLISI